jgi:hypothetical protein
MAVLNTTSPVVAPGANRPADKDRAVCELHGVRALPDVPVETKALSDFVTVRPRYANVLMFLLAAL